MSDVPSLRDAKLQKFRESYVDLFGCGRPDPPAASTSPASSTRTPWRTAEELRAQVFDKKTFDMKTTQLILFGMLLVGPAQPDRRAATCARRAPRRRKLAGSRTP